MKTSSSAPAPRNRAGRRMRRPAAPVPAAIQRGKQLKAQASGQAVPAAPAPPPAVPAQPRYDTNLTYGMPGLRYPVADSELPVNDGGKVKMSLDTRNYENLLAFVSNHIFQMTGNPNFTTPVPSAPDLLALFTGLQEAQAAWMAAKTALDDAAAAREASRLALIDGMNLRGSYVQTASNGNRQVIISSGLEVRNYPTPVGQLPPPVDLSAELNGTTGLMKFKWKPVYKARGYLLECSPDVQPRAFSPLATTTKANAQKLLPAGDKFAFRVAAIGGTTGQSYWSEEIVRGSA